MPSLYPTLKARPLRKKISVAEEARVSISSNHEQGKMAERVGFERFHVLQAKDLPLESIASPDTILNFRRGIAHELAHGSGLR